ncbi:4a-hydroxytetrahydrobiopterin dehydratase [Thiothrix subterranea]|uniref:4a-hydroxytetrahydrobiopterin dehydratase n=1 Tax=Thiothrix subterranea TaxID=2735563 RepID=A0AA51MQ19_9GAMM|nr:4a-hydroxytetrahydrobiopterin dehydratase [Thiothrix subterranea]WML88203.1 4a-hydroxytetrahydrobiopterin dehydratase [Thiothrix subterranea]
MTATQPSAAWHIQQRPAAMTRRYDFASYSETRTFLDQLAALSERTGYHPNLNFARNHVSVSINADGETLGDVEYTFAAEADHLAQR